MKTDRELLELAAKAAGIKIVEFLGASMIPTIKVGKDFLEWNPLLDDGDALRLAVKLELSIEHTKHAVHVGPSGDEADDTASESVAGKTLHRDRSTRRAIVRAAAAIGESMP